MNPHHLHGGDESQPPKNYWLDASVIPVTVIHNTLFPKTSTHIQSVNASNVFGSSTLGFSIRRFIFERIKISHCFVNRVSLCFAILKSGYGFSTFYRETARDVRAKFIVEAANHPTDPEADEVSKLRFAFHRVSTVECFIIRFSIDNYSRNLATRQSYIA